MACVNGNSKSIETSACSVRAPRDSLESRNALN